MTPFSEPLRYEYPLTPDSVVVDAGCYEGNFSAILHDKYGCQIIALEPVPEFFHDCHQRFRNTPKVRVLNFALGADFGTTHLGVRGDQSGSWCDSESKAECGTITPRSLLALAEERGQPNIALTKLNIEGGEFSVLEFILREHIATRFEHIQVQFHKVVPAFLERHDTICARLLATHEMIYHEPFCWTGFSLRR